MKYISIVLFLSCFLYPQTQDEIIKLAKVSVVGNVATSENTILFTAGLREGQTITPADFPRAIKRLWQLGLFQDVQIKYDEESDEDAADEQEEDEVEEQNIKKRKKKEKGDV